MLTLTLVLNASFWWRRREEAREGGEHNNQPKEGRAAKMPATEAMQQAMTSQFNERTRGRCNNDDAVERHVCIKVVQLRTIITQRHIENPLALLEQGFVRVFLGPR
jgi:hypothetical protein